MCGSATGPLPHHQNAAARTAPRQVLAAKALVESGGFAIADFCFEEDAFGAALPPWASRLS